MLLELLPTSDHEFTEVTARRVPAAAKGGITSRGRPPADVVEEWGLQSFPASDPPANW